MVVIAALTFVLGFALGQFYRVLVLLPATTLVVAGVSIFESVARHSSAHGALCVLLAASALQAGFLSASLLSGLVVGVSKPASSASPRPK